MSVTRNRVIQWLGIILLLLLVGGGYWYFSVRASTLNKSPTGSLTNGLVGYWTFDGADTTATTITDRSGNGYSATRNGGTSTTSGKIGQALSLNGANTTNVTAPGSALNNLTQFTACVWVNPSALVNTDADPSNFILSKKWFLSYDNTGLAQFAINTDGAYPRAYSATKLVVNRWQHLCGVAYGVGTEPKLFLDGVDVSDNTDFGSGTQANDSTSPLTLGSQHDNDYYVNYPGKLDEVRIYNRILSASEIKSLYDLGASDKVNTSVSQSQGAGRLDSGLAGYWPLDENTGTSAGDKSTNANNGTLTNGPTWTTGQISTGVDFDGTDDYITVADSGALDFYLVGTASGDDTVTIAGWFNRDTFTTDDTILAKKNDQSTGIGYIVWIDDADDRLHVQLYGDNAVSSTIASKQTFTTTGWNHFVVVLGIEPTGGDQPQIYINGVSNDDLATGSGYQHYVHDMSNALAFRVGAESDNGNPFDGKLDDIRVYNRALSTDEIAQLYRLTTPTGVDTSLKGYWSFDGPTVIGTSAYDLSGAGNTGTLTNGPTKTIGKIGQAISFDGVNDDVTITDPGTGSVLDFANASNITLSTWLKPAPFDGTWGTIISKEVNNTSASTNYSLNNNVACSASACEIVFYYDTGSCNGSVVQIFITNLPVLSAGSWQHIAVTYTFGTGSTIKLYVNGVEQAGTWSTGNGNIAPCQGNERLIMGLNYDGDTFDGAIDETRIYNRTLSASEIKSLYDLGASDKVNTSASQSQGAGRLDSGLAGYWPLDENTGTSAGDKSTNANTGTLTNGPTWTTGRIGSAVNLDGVDDYVSLGAPTALSLSEAMTACAWIYVETDPVSDARIVANSDSSDFVQQYSFEVENNRAIDFFWSNNAGSVRSLVTAASTIQLNTWYHVCAVRSSTTAGTIYRDGVALPTTVTGGSIATTGFGNTTIGRSGSSNASYFDGKIDDVRLYNRALSTDEIAQLYRLTTPTGVDTSLKGYWSFDGPTVIGTSASDLSGAGNTGTMTGTTKTTGKLGQGLSFDGSGGVNAADSTSLDITSGEISMSAWVYPSAFPGASQYSFIFGKDDNYYLYLYNGGSGNLDVDFGFASTGPSYRDEKTTTHPIVKINEWYHIVATFRDSSNSIAMYVNGVLQADDDGASAYSPIADNNPLHVGYAYGSYSFMGKIDEVRLYNRTLTATEVADLYNRGK